MFRHEICVYKFLAHPVGRSLPLISSLPKFTPNQASQIPMAPKKNATNNFAVNQPTVNQPAVNQLTAMPARANLAVYPAASASVDVPSHQYGTSRKIRTLAQLYGQTLSVLNNPLYDTKEAPTVQTFSMSRSTQGGQLLKEPEGYSSGSSAHSSPRKSSASKTSSGVMAVMMTGSVTLEEQVAILAKRDRKSVV